MFDLKKVVEEANHACYPHLFSQATSEANQERRASEIERIAAESMREGGKFYPFADDNFYDAVNKITNGVMDGFALQQKMIAYCKKCALVDAAKHYKD